MLLDKLAFTENKYEELSVKISDPSIMANQKEWRKLCKEHADLEIIVTAYREYKKESCLNRLGHDFFYCNLRYISPIFFLNNNKIQWLN